MSITSKYLLQSNQLGKLPYHDRLQQWKFPWSFLPQCVFQQDVFNWLGISGFEVTFILLYLKTICYKDWLYWKFYIISLRPAYKCDTSLISLIITSFTFLVPVYPLQTSSYSCFSFPSQLISKLFSFQPHAKCHVHDMSAWQVNPFWFAWLQQRSNGIA